MNWGLVITALGLFGVLPLAGFALARRAPGRMRLLVGLVAALMVAAALAAFMRGHALGFFDGFDLTLMGIGCAALAHLLLAGLADGWIAARPGWGARPILLRGGVTAGLALTGFTAVLLWPWVD
ncbi:hypothetical protein [Anianabacter salinae]|uniref:hypothetical protein n=1 Tax=Anianabacter salinae TaxID=2851023 RepID=UPI00225E4E62|nr:hypothetical protein [Anianabacter salinae]MBV0913073.1 hypothetical protein [Anianabacter salinae]